MNIITGNKNYLYLIFKIKQLLRALTKQIKLKAFGKNDNKINKIFIINLDRQIDRWDLIKKELKRLPISKNENLLDYAERFSAIDAKKASLSTDKINNSYRLQDQYFVDPDPRLLDIIREKEINIELTKQELAVALSHVTIWEKIVHENIPNTLILEDDVFFENRFSEKLNSLWKEIVSSSVVRNLNLLFNYHKQ